MQTIARLVTAESCTSLDLLDLTTGVSAEPGSKGGPVTEPQSGSLLPGSNIYGRK